MLSSLAKAIRQKKGFTLLEALLALFLLTVAVVSFVPVYQNMSRTARKKETKARLLAIREALLDYYYQSLKKRREDGGTISSLLPSEDSFWDDLRPFLVSIRSEDIDRDAWHKKFVVHIYEPQYNAVYCPLKSLVESAYPGSGYGLPKVLIVSKGPNGELESNIPSDDFNLNWTSPSGSDDISMVVSFTEVDSKGRDFTMERVEDISNALKNYFMTKFIADSASQGPDAVNNDYFADFFGSGQVGDLATYAENNGSFLGFTATDLRDFWGNDLYFLDGGETSPPYHARVWSPCGYSKAVPGVI